jgi:hypothetical protein
MAFHFMAESRKESGPSWRSQTGFGRTLSVRHNPVYYSLYQPDLKETTIPGSANVALSVLHRWVGLQMYMRDDSKFGRWRLNAKAARLILLASILCHWCLGQSLNRPIKSLYHTRWTVRDGVPNDIVAIQQTRDGYLWLGTGEGLFRFDGVRFERYKPSRGSELFTGRISALLATTGWRFMDCASRERSASEFSQER